MFTDEDKEAQCGLDPRSHQQKMARAKAEL